MLHQIRYALIIAGAVLIAALIYVKLPFGAATNTATSTPPENTTAIAGKNEIVPASSTIQIVDRIVRVAIADIPEARTQGLSGREGLAEDEGMLFVFEEDGRPAFWMKDMRFAIDILWISRDGAIVHIEENVGPDTYPTAFAPRNEARYVVELPAGWVERYNVGLGDMVGLPQ